MTALKMIFIVVLITVAIVFGLRVLTPEDSWICTDGSWQRHGNPSTPMPTTSCKEDQVIPTPTVTETVKESNTKVYSNTKMGFSVSIPKDIKTTENIDGTISFFKWGPTQKTETELFDGFSVNIDQGSIGLNKDFKSLIESDIEQKIQQLSPDFKVIKQVASYGSGGFTYTAQDAFGIVNYYYIPQKNDKFLLIITIVKDPGNLGFEKIVGDIVSGITMTK